MGLLLLPSFSSPSDTLWDLGHVGAEAALVLGTRCRKVPPDPPYAAATANALRPTLSRPGPRWVPVTFDDLKRFNHNQRLPRLGCCGLLCPRVPVVFWAWLWPLALRVLLLRDYEPNGVSRKITTARRSRTEPQHQPTRRNVLLLISPRKS